MRVIVLFVAAAVLCLPALVPAAFDPPDTRSGGHTIYWSEDWESGMGLWAASNGVWEVGAPTYGTSECINSKCAATNLDGEYPYNTYSRLESVSIELPDSPDDGVLWLGFWHWFSNSASYGVDYGSVQIWTVTEGWAEVSNHFVGNATVWTPFYLDISEYANQTIKIGFLFNDEQSSYDPVRLGPGWYVDHIRIFDGAFPEPAQISRFDKCMDMDWDGWYPDQGVWELGEPTAGIDAAHSSRRCFGTNLSGNYPYGVYSRLISPPITLNVAPLDGRLYFSFKQYCSLSSSYGIDQGRVQIDDGTGWVTLYTLDWHNNLGKKWSEKVFDISEYVGQVVKFGFVVDDNQTSYDPAYQSFGWYIDDLQFSEGDRYAGNPERFENYSPSWLSTRGVWEVGVPTVGPATAYSGVGCWGTNLTGNYPYGTDDRLESPPITLDNVSGLYLRFQHWYSFSGSYGVDFGVVRIKPAGGDWTDISGHFTGSSGAWTQWTYDLSSYTGQTVQFGLQIFDQQTSYDPAVQSSGWYMDDFEIVGMSQREAPLNPFALEVAITSGPADLFFPHIIDNIEKVVIYGSPVEDFLPTLGTRLAVLSPSSHSWTDDDRPGWPAIYYRVSIVDDLGNESVPIAATSLSPVPDANPALAAGILSLKGVSPNPFNPTTYIEFGLTEAAMVEVEVYDLSGRKVADVLHKNLEAGPHRVPFTPGNLASGVYCARVSIRGQAQMARMTILK